MDSEYYKITSEIDAREVLRYLNNLGINNISGEVLKYFITDLKKYIKYDLQQRRSSSAELHRNDEVLGPERLHSASTFSSRTRSRVQEAPVTCSRECQKSRRPFREIKTQSAPNVGQKIEEKPLRRACSCVKIERKPGSVSAKSTVASIAPSNNLITVVKQPTIKKCDPVILYQYYTEMWDKYKSNLPGENNWSELRWNVRQKMAGQVPNSVKVPELKLKGKCTVKD